MRTARYLLYALGGALVALLLGLLALRVWTPDLALHKTRIENYLSSQSKRPIQIGDLVAEWDGWSPILRASGLRIRSRDGTFSALRLDEFIVQVDLLRLILGTVTFERFVLNRPALDVIRQPDGKFRVGDIVTGGTGEGGMGFLRWLFRQGEVRVTDGVIAWIDDASAATVMELNDVDLRFRKDGDRHSISGEAQCRDALCTGIRIEGTLHGDPPDEPNWHGTVRADIRAARPENLLPAISPTAAVTVRGRGDLVLSGEFARGNLSSVNAAVTAPQLRLVKDGHVLPGFSGQASWQRIDPARWRITFQDATLHADQGELMLDDLKIDHTESVTTLTLGGLDIASVAPHALAWTDTKLGDRLAPLKPHGRLRNLVLRVTEQGGFPAGWRFQADLDGLGWEPSEKIPGVSKVSAQLLVGPEGGMLDVDTQYTNLMWPAELDEALGWAEVKGRLGWTRQDGRWLVEGEDLRLTNQDLALRGGRFRATLPADTGVSVMHAAAHLDRGKVAKVRRYVPKRASPKLKKWLANALVDGDLTDATIKFEGAFKDFPFRDGHGEFEAVGRVSGGELKYHKKWPVVTGARTEVRFHNQGLTVTGDAGRFMNADVIQARVEIADLYTKARTVQIEGALRTPVADVIDFLRRGPLTKRPIDLDIVGTGTGHLELEVTLPLKTPKQTQVKGQYRTAGSQVTIAQNVVLNELKGGVRFTDSTVQGEGLSAQLFGGEAGLSVRTIEPGRPPVFAIEGRGHADVGQLAPILGQGLFDYVHGSSDWSASLLVENGQARLDVDTDLTGVNVELPPPLKKPSHFARPLTTRVEFLGGERQQVGFDYDQQLTGALLLAKRPEHWQVAHGEFRLGKGVAVLPESEGLRIAVATDVLDVDPWLEWLRALPANEPGTDRPDLFEALREFEGEVGAARLFGREIGALSLRARSKDSARWDAQLNGAAGQGTAVANIKSTPRRYSLRMNEFRWPRAEGAGQTSDTNPGTFPVVEIDAERFHFGEMRLGQLRFRAAPVAGGWKIAELTTEQPELKIAAVGDWQRRGTEHQTRVQATVNTPNLGDALKALGFAGQIADGNARLKGELNWDDSVTAFEYEKLSGNFELVAKDGRFLKVEPGTGRILGLLNLEALTRRLELDFSDVFSKGLAFDRIEGQGAIQRGDLITEGLLLIGPAALIEAEGRVGLAKEDYDLELIVAPQVGGNLGWLGALIANPAAGAVLFVTNKLFKKQLAKVVHTRYRVTGPWTTPEIGRVESAALQEEEGDVGGEPEKEGG
ncbi:MAG: YhdP family protein [Gammaproteobacteria bacterium]|nr:YhdP family protein [Gammaproteobacteria bacterium]